MIMVHHRQPAIKNHDFKYKIAFKETSLTQCLVLPPLIWDLTLTGLGQKNLSFPNLNP